MGQDSMNGWRASEYLRGEAREKLARESFEERGDEETDVAVLDSEPPRLCMGTYTPAGIHLFALLSDVYDEDIDSDSESGEQGDEGRDCAQPALSVLAPAGPRGRTRKSVGAVAIVGGSEGVAIGFDDMTKQSTRHQTQGRVCS